MENTQNEFASGAKGATPFLDQTTRRWFCVMVLAVVGTGFTLIDESRWGGGVAALAVVVGLSGLKGLSLVGRVTGAVALVCLALGACMALAAPVRASVASEETRAPLPTRWFDIHAWEDVASGERWMELFPVAPMLVEEVGAEPVWIHFDPAELVATIADRPTVPESARIAPLDLDLVALNGLMGDVVYAHMSNSGGSSLAPCELSCYDLRKQSPHYSGLLDASTQSGLTDTVGGGLMAIGGGLITWIVAGGVVKATAAGATLAAGALLGVAVVAGAVLIVGGLTMIQNATDDAYAAAEDWAANPSNGCPGCGYEMTGTKGWVYDAGADVCYDPECSDGNEPQEQEEAGGGGSSSGGDGDGGIDPESLQVCEVDGDSDDFGSGPPTFAGAGGGEAGSVPSTCEGTEMSYSGEDCEDVPACEEMPGGVDDDTVCNECYGTSGDLEWSTCTAGVGESEPEDTQAN